MQFFRHRSHLKHTHTWFREEELANAVTHSIGLLLSIIAFYFLLLKSISSAQNKIILAAVIYGLCVVSTFLVSSIFHALIAPRLKKLFHLLDHLFIYFMIAGTYTPFTLITLQGVWGNFLFAIIWILAAIGIIGKIFFMGKMPKLSTLFYIIMGWIGIIAIAPIIHALPNFGLMWLFAGAILYSLGVFFFILESVPFSHTVWHILVILAASCQFICIYYYVI